MRVVSCGGGVSGERSLLFSDQGLRIGIARERQRIDAQCTHDIFLAKLLELSAAKIDIKSKHIFEFYKTVSSKGNKSQQKCCLPYSLVVSCNMLISVAELSQASSSTAWRIMRRGKLRGALPSRRLFART